MDRRIYYKPTGEVTSNVFLSKRVSEQSKRSQKWSVQQGHGTITAYYASDITRMIFVLCKNIGQEMIVAVASDTMVMYNPVIGKVFISENS